MAWRQTPARHWPLHVANPSARQRPRFKTPRPHICEHAPENTQNHTARFCYPSYSRLTSPQLPCPAACVPDRPISPNIGFWCGLEQSTPTRFGCSESRGTNIFFEILFIGSWLTNHHLLIHTRMMDLRPFHIILYWYFAHTNL